MPSHDHVVMFTQYSTHLSIIRSTWPIRRVTCSSSSSSAPFGATWFCLPSERVRRRGRGSACLGGRVDEWAMRLGSVSSTWRGTKNRRENTTSRIACATMLNPSSHWLWSLLWCSASSWSYWVSRALWFYCNLVHHWGKQYSDIIAPDTCTGSPSYL